MQKHFYFFGFYNFVFLIIHIKQFFLAIKYLDTATLNLFLCFSLAVVPLNDISTYYNAEKRKSSFVGAHLYTGMQRLRKYIHVITEWKMLWFF